MTKPREPAPTVAFIDDYCAHYRAVFPNVRQFEQFTQLELGLLAETKRKSLPRLAQTAQADHQALHHFLANAEWSVDELRAIRLHLTRDALAAGPLSSALTRPVTARKGRRPTMRPANTSAICTAGQRRGLGQCLRGPRHRHLPPGVSPLQAADAPKGGDVYQSKPQWPSN